MKEKLDLELNEDFFNPSNKSSDESSKKTQQPGYLGFPDNDLINIEETTAMQISEMPQEYELLQVKEDLKQTGYNHKGLAKIIFSLIKPEIFKVLYKKFQEEDYSSQKTNISISTLAATTQIFETLIVIALKKYAEERNIQELKFFEYDNNNYPVIDQKASWKLHIQETFLVEILFQQTVFFDETATDCKERLEEIFNIIALVSKNSKIGFKTQLNGTKCIALTFNMGQLLDLLSAANLLFKAPSTNKILPSTSKIFKINPREDLITDIKNIFPFEKLTFFLKKHILCLLELKDLLAFLCTNKQYKGYKENFPKLEWQKPSFVTLNRERSESISLIYKDLSSKRYYDSGVTKIILRQVNEKIFQAIYNCFEQNIKNNKLTKKEFFEIDKLTIGNPTKEEELFKTDKLTIDNLTKEEEFFETFVLLAISICSRHTDYPLIFLADDNNYPTLKNKAKWKSTIQRDTLGKVDYRFAIDYFTEAFTNGHNANSILEQNLTAIKTVAKYFKLDLEVEPKNNKITLYMNLDTMLSLFHLGGLFAARPSKNELFNIKDTDKEQEKKLENSSKYFTAKC